MTLLVLGSVNHRTVEEALAAVGDGTTRARPGR
jgi:hypothetical protein